MWRRAGWIDPKNKESNMEVEEDIGGLDKALSKYEEKKYEKVLDTNKAMLVCDLFNYKCKSNKLMF